MDPEIYYSCITLSVYVLVGVLRSFLAFLVNQLKAPDSIIGLTENEEAWLGSCITLLTPLGCIFSGFLMDFFGRKLFLSAMFVPYALSWFMISIAKNVTTLYVAIIIQSVCMGMSFCVSTYVAEICTARHRGALLSVLEITFSAGILICYVSMYYFQWNVVAIGYGIFSLLCLLLTTRLPESPVWLYMRDRKEKSIQVLMKLRRLPREEIEEEILSMEKARYQKTQKNFSVASAAQECVRAWKPLAMVLVMVLLMQCSGFTIMLAFIIRIVNRLRLPYFASDVSVMYSVSGFVASCVTPFVIHRLGSKMAVTLSAAGMALSMGVIGVYEELYYDEEVKPVPWIVPLYLILYNFVCTLGVFPVGFMIGGEVFPSEARGLLNGIYGAFGFGISTIIFKFFPSYMTLVGVKGVVWSFAAFGILLSIYAMLVLPETRNKTLDQIQEEYFGRRRRVRADEEEF